MEALIRKPEPAADRLKDYAPPAVARLGNIAEVTRECSNWQCSVVVPPAPPS